MESLANSQGMQEEYSKVLMALQDGADPRALIASGVNPDIVKQAVQDTIQVEENQMKYGQVNVPEASLAYAR